MKFDKKALIAIAIGWCVLFYILLLTTSASISPLYSIFDLYRPNRLGVALFAILAIEFVLIILLLVCLLRVWLFAIKLTRALVRFIFFGEGASTEGDISDIRISTELLFILFGQNAKKLNGGLFWTLRTFIIIWAIIILITLLSGFFVTYLTTLPY